MQQSNINVSVVQFSRVYYHETSTITCYESSVIV